MNGYNECSPKYWEDAWSHKPPSEYVLERQRDIWIESWIKAPQKEEIIRAMNEGYQNALMKQVTGK